jgi:hypothetical protein
VLIVIDFILKKTIFKRKPLTVAEDLWTIESFDPEDAPAIEAPPEEAAADTEDSIENS